MWRREPMGSSVNNRIESLTVADELVEKRGPAGGYFFTATLFYLQHT